MISRIKPHMKKNSDFTRSWQHAVNVYKIQKNKMHVETKKHLLGFYMWFMGIHTSSNDVRAFLGIIMNLLLALVIPTIFMVFLNHTAHWIVIEFLDNKKMLNENFLETGIEIAFVWWVLFILGLTLHYEKNKERLELKLEILSKNKESLQELMLLSKEVKTVASNKIKHKI